MRGRVQRLFERMDRARAVWQATEPAATADMRAAEDALLAAQRQVAELTRRVAALEEQVGTLRRERPTRYRLAYFSPLSPQPTGIAAYSEALLPALAELADVEVFVGDVAPTHPALTRLPVYGYQAYPARRRAHPYHATLYHMGNFTAYHAHIYATLARFPGLVMLHDFVLHHFMAGYTLDQGRPEDYAWELGYALGRTGVELGRAVVRQQRPLPVFDHPLVEHILDLSQGVLCHSEFVRRQVATLRPSLPTAVVGHATALTEPPAARRPSAFTVVSAGYLTPAKGLDAALAGFALFRQTHPDARYVLVGAAESGFDVARLLAERTGAGEGVEWRGYAASLDDFDAAIAGADALLNLRYPTAGETSGSVIRATGLGVPVIVSDVGWFSELPDSVGVKVPVPHDPAAIARALASLADDPIRRARMREAARRYFQAHHTPAAAARDYLAFVERVVAPTAAEPPPAP